MSVKNDMTDNCEYPDCRCPFDMGPENLCLIGKPNPDTRHSASVPEESRPLPANRYGVDRDYFTKKLEILIRDMRDFTPDELARSLGRLAMTADSETMQESEFTTTPQPAPLVPDSESFDLLMRDITEQFRADPDHERAVFVDYDWLYERIERAFAATPHPEGDGWIKPTGRKHHDLKTDPAVFRQSLNGAKPWEIRCNDRDFVRGDTVTLHETKSTGEEMVNGAPLALTGRNISGVISYVLTGPVYGLADGWCIFSVAANPLAEQESE